MSENNVVHTFPAAEVSSTEMIIGKFTGISMTLVAVAAGYGILALSKIGTSETALTTDYSIAIIAIIIMIGFFIFRIRSTMQQEALHKNMRAYICEHLKGDVDIDEASLKQAMDGEEVISRDGRKVTVIRVDKDTMKLVASERNLVVEN